MKLQEQTRNLNPTPEAVAAMWLYGQMYAESRKGSMDFWDGLDAYRKRQAQRLVEDIDVARRQPVVNGEYAHRLEEQMTDSETKYYTDRYYPLLWALRDRPDLPPPMVLHVLSQAATFSLDWEEGKRIQRERGLEAVPPVTECEMGAGFWHRVIKPVPAVAKVA